MIAFAELLLTLFGKPDPLAAPVADVVRGHGGCSVPKCGAAAMPQSSSVSVPALARIAHLVLANPFLQQRMVGCGCVLYAVEGATHLRVEVLVPVLCVKADQVPAKPIYQFDKLLAQDSDGVKVLALASDWPVGRKYEVKLEAAIACRR